MVRTSRTTLVPRAQPITTLSVRTNIPISQTKPTRATTWLVPRFKPVAPLVRVDKTGQRCVYSTVVVYSGELFGHSLAIISFVHCVPANTFCQDCQQKNRGRDHVWGCRARWGAPDRRKLLARSTSSHFCRIGGSATRFGKSFASWFARSLRMGGERLLITQTPRADDPFGVGTTQRCF